MKFNDIAPLITEKFAEAMVHWQIAEDNFNDSAEAPHVAALNDAAHDLKECFLALYPNLVSDPLQAYKNALLQLAKATGADSVKFAVNDLLSTAKADLGEVTAESPDSAIDTATPAAQPEAPGMSRAQEASLRREGRHASVRHGVRQAGHTIASPFVKAGARIKKTTHAIEQRRLAEQAQIHANRQGRRAHIAAPVHQWAHRLDEK